MKLSFSLFIILIVLSIVILDCTARRTVKRNISSKSKDSKNSKSSSDDSKDDPKPTKIDYKELGIKTEARRKRSEIQKNVTKELYFSIIWPKSAQLAAAIELGNYSVVSHLITADVIGRISPLGRFDTFVETGEYFFGLAGPLPGVSTTGRNRVTNVIFDRIFCSDNQCSYRMVATLKDFATNQSISNYTHLGYTNFNSNNQICSYEVDFLGLSRKDVPETPTARNASLNSLCNGIQALCTGNNQQYASFAECVDFMRSIPYGGWGQADQNTQQCRSIHLSLVRTNPTTHCPHTGPLGGGKCVFHPETSYHGEGFDTCRDKNY